MNFTVYKASAGSGKTFRLAIEYVRLSGGPRRRPWGSSMVAHAGLGRGGLGRRVDLHRVAGVHRLGRQALLLPSLLLRGFGRNRGEQFPAPRAEG